MTKQEKRLEIVRGLLQLIQFEIDNDKDERVVRLVRILDNTLGQFADEDMIEDFYNNLDQLENRN